jgi:hypothetical protein
MHRLLVFAFLATSLHAQSSDGFLNQLPAAAMPCGASLDTKHTFYKKIDDIVKKIDDLEQEQIQQSKAASKAEEERFRQQIGGAYKGLSGEQKLSTEERKALAAQTVKAQTGMTMDQVEQLKKMTPEQRRDWAMGHSSEIMAASQAANANQIGASKILGNKQNSKINPEDVKELESIKNELQALQKQMTGRIFAIGQRYQQTEKEFNLTPRPPFGQKDSYCSNYAGRYKAILIDHMTALRQNLQDSSRLADLMIRQAKLQAKMQGLSLSDPPKQDPGLAIVREYAQSLREIFSYDRSIPR